MGLSYNSRMQNEERRGLLYAALAVGLLSTSPVLTLWADPLDPFVKTGLRMSVAAIALWSAVGVGWLRGGAGRAAEAAPGLAPRSRQATALRFAAYGLIAALHFLFYIASLSYTSPAQSLTLVYTAPVFVALFAAAFLHEPIRRRQWAGMLVAIAGVALLANPFAPYPGHPNWLLGDALALGSAVMFGFYSVAGRYERARYPLLRYAGGVYTAAALWLLPAMALTWPRAGGAPVSTGAWLAVAALGIFPLALGHTLYNAGLRLVHAASVNVIAAQEVTGGVLLSWLLLGIAPTPTELIGGAFTLAGMWLVVSG